MLMRIMIAMLFCVISSVMSAPVSDRITALEQEVKKLGIEVPEAPNDHYGPKMLELIQEGAKALNVKETCFDCWCDKYWCD